MWFASNLLFLHYQSQRKSISRASVLRCDLLRIYYFCTINHSNIRWTVKVNSVVICFEFIIFALSITAAVLIRVRTTPLWFASNLLFLHYQSQRLYNHKAHSICCDLLRIYYFCTINHSEIDGSINSKTVVICFEFIIFALSITARCPATSSPFGLWFASNLLFLHYQSQLGIQQHFLERSCDLLRIYYFCTINHSLIRKGVSFEVVVICFEFIIFALSITALGRIGACHQCCDLLRIYYFCTINHSRLWRGSYRWVVVICFEFIIFALSITAICFFCCLFAVLWFASNLLFLHYQSQPYAYYPWFFLVVICFEFIIFALSITAKALSA